jgi:hypothetical protein
MSRTALTWIIVIVALVILGAVIVAGDKNDEININDIDSGYSDTDNDKEGDVSGYVIGKNALNVADQPVGSTVRASMAVLEAKGFVVIHERMATGGAGAVLGASALLPAGQSDNVAITLSKPLVDGKTYIAMIHLDNGDGTPSETNDPAAKDANGNTILMEFKADANAKVDASVNL